MLVDLQESVHGKIEIGVPATLISTIASQLKESQGRGGSSARLEESDSQTPTREDEAADCTDLNDNFQSIDKAHCQFVSHLCPDIAFYCHSVDQYLIQGNSYFQSSQMCSLS